jgi:predicted ATPase/class 3 adenylate cyclase
MAELPSGTVTFLFTDIEGSTRLWAEAPAAMGRALECHDALVRGGVEAASGYIFSTGGDGFGVAFGRADQAVAAAASIQQALAVENWPDGAPVRVRMAVHTGEAEERAGDYFGPAVNRAARLMAAAHGGQVLCSGVSAGLMTEHLPPGCRLVDLGPHRLRDLTSPEHVHQVVIPGVPEHFPPLRSLDTYPGNLPIQATAFVGREHEVKELAQWLLKVRVVTLTGVGGVGKTRLALQAAAEVLPEFRDGVWLVELAGVGGPEAVPEAVASALGIAAGPAPAPGGGLEEHLRASELLLILDNCEHLLTPVAHLVEQIVRTAPGVRVLATSREGLGVAGEHLRAVPSLELPDPTDEPGVIAATDSVRLFVERAREASAAYRFSDEDSQAVAELCRRLDGIPLAIELAAARVPALTPAEIAAHLDRRFKLLTGGRRVAMSRHQTLRNAIEWSYQLLDPSEQAVLARLAVFAGGFDLPSAQAVAATDAVDPIDVLDIVARLVAKSLVVAEPRDGVTRYRLLETVRDFAWERLQNADEEENVSRRHAVYFAEFARSAGSGLRGPHEADWRQRVEREVDNLRVALTWAIGAGDVRLALEPINSLALFGDSMAPFGPAAEGAARLAEDHPLAAVALGAACFAATLQGDTNTSLRLAQEAQRRAAALDRSAEGLWVRCRVDNATVMTMATAGEEDIFDFGRRWLADARELGDPGCLCEVLTFMAGVSSVGEAVAAGEEALILARQLQAPSRVAFAAVFLAPRLADTDPGRAEALLQEATDAAALAGNEWVEFVSPTALLQYQAQGGNHRAAAETAVNAIERWATRGGMAGLALQFVGYLAGLLAAMGDDEGALVLAARAEQRGWVMPLFSDYWTIFGAAELSGARERTSSSELQRLARVAADLDEAAVAPFARERLAGLARGTTSSSTEASS